MKDRRRYAFYEAPIFSFFSREFYQDVALRWNGYGFCYLVFLQFVSLLPGAFQLHDRLKTYLAEESPTLVHQVPEIMITRGAVTVQQTMPIAIKDSRGLTQFIIDTSGDVASLEKSEARGLLTKNQIIFKNSKGDIRIYDLSRVDKFALTQQQLERWLGRIEKWFVPVFIILRLIALTFYRIAQVLLLGTFGRWYAARKKISMPYKTGVRLASVALSPTLIVNALVGLLGLNVPFWWVIKLAMMASCVVFAVQSNFETFIQPRHEEFLLRRRETKS